tara:strand:+ start:238 stop:504 length:267 start_codon:yes stop_codon:yes gene_type:complete
MHVIINDQYVEKIMKIIKEHKTYYPENSKGVGQYVRQALTEQIEEDLKTMREKEKDAIRKENSTLEESDNRTTTNSTSTTRDGPSTTE